MEYAQDGAVLEGYLAWDDSIEGKRPGVVVVHAWRGLDDYTKMRTRMLAEMGYVAFAADVYGKGVRATSSDEARALSGKYRGDRNLLRARVNAALDVLKAQRMTDMSRTAAIGYCFGGTAVLELGRSGADVNGIVSFHGGLDTLTPEDAINIKAKVLVLHGAEDPVVPPKQVAAFQDEMRNAGVDWQMIYYSGAVHSFTGPANKKSYNEAADRRSWEAMKLFFKEIFGE